MTLLPDIDDKGSSSQPLKSNYHFNKEQDDINWVSFSSFLIECSSINWFNYNYFINIAFQKMKQNLWNDKEEAHYLKDNLIKLLTRSKFNDNN